VSAVSSVRERMGRPSAGYLLTQILHRKLLVFRNSWIAFLTGFTEPVFYLFSIGIGVGALVEGFTFNGEVLDYADFVAPGMLAAAAMNGAIYDATFNFFYELRYSKLYDQWLNTPLSSADVARGEMAWTLIRGGLYSLAFWVVMVSLGMATSWLAILALPAAVLVALAFAGIGMALTTYLRSWQDFDYVNLITMPMLLFSGTFFPVTSLPDPVRWLVEVTPLYRGVVLCRELTTGAVTVASAVSVVYLVAVGLVGLAIVRRRLDRLLLT
jgi:lipooligosaccharide transport system permease protein